MTTPTQSTPIVEQLIALLGREAMLFESFLALLDEQQKALVENNVTTLQEVTERQREKTIESRILNREREAVIADLKTANAIDGDVNVTRLLQVVDAKHAVQLEKLRTILLALTDKITRARNRNAMLLNRSREYIAQTMAMLSRMQQPESSYGSNGTAVNQTGIIAVDRRG
jgi:hypothetical protein